MPTLGLEHGTATFEAPELSLELVRASQTVAALRTRDSHAFDYTPGDWLERRDADGYFHLGDLTLRLRSGTGPWERFSTAEDRSPVRPLPATGRVLAAADLAPTLPAGIPLESAATGR